MTKVIAEKPAINGKKKYRPIHWTVLLANKNTGFYYRIIILASPKQSNRVPLVLIESCNRHVIRAKVNELSKQAKRRECLPRAVSQHSIYLRYIRPTDNARQTNRQ